MPIRQVDPRHQAKRSPKQAPASGAAARIRPAAAEAPREAARKAATADGYEAGSGKGAVSPFHGDAKVLAQRWAAHYPERKVIPKVGDRGTVGSLDEAQLAVVHRLFWTAPPGAERQDIAKLALKDPAFKGKTEITDNQLNLITQYRPESFPFGWTDRKRAFCSYLVVQALLTTPKDVAADTMLKQLRGSHEGFLSEVAIKRFAKSEWVDSPAQYPFAAKLERRKDGKGYVVTTLGELKGLPKFGGKLANSEELALRVTELARDPRVRYGWQFEDLLKFIADEIGEPFTASLWKHLREKFPQVPDWFALQTDARQRYAELAGQVCRERGLTSLADIGKVMHEELGFADVEPQRFVVLRREFPGSIPELRQSQLDSLLADADELAAAVKKAPAQPLDQVGARLGFDANRVKGLIRVLRLRDPDALPLRKAPNRTYSDGERKVLREAVEALPIGATYHDLWRAMNEDHPEFFIDRPLRSHNELGGAVREQLGITDFRQLQRDRFEQTLVASWQHADSGVTLRESIDWMRDEHDCRFGYEYLKLLIRDVEAHPKDHPALAALKNEAGRYPWEIGFELDEQLARRVSAEMNEHPDRGLRQTVGALMKDKDFAAKHPAFGTGHIQMLRERFPHVVPYVDDIKTPTSRAATRTLNGHMGKLADRIGACVKKLPDGVAPTLSLLSRELGVALKDVRRAVIREPERFPWYRHRPTGNIDLALAYRVAHEMEQAPIGTSLPDIVAKLKDDEAFAERYPAFCRATLGTLREVYPDLVPAWLDRDLVLRGKLIVDAVREAPKGMAWEEIVAKLEKQHPGATSGNYAVEAQVRWYFKSDPERFPFAEVLKGEDGTYILTGRGETLPKADQTPSELATRSARLARVPKELDLVSFIAEQVKDAPLDSGRRYEFVCVQHLLDSQLPTFDALKKLGMSPARTTVIGVPYSSSDLVVQAMEDRGWDVRVPPLDMDVWVEDVRAALYERLESALSTKRDIAVMDDGGIVAKLVSTDPVLKEHANIFKIVEQTRRGITVADEIDLAAPVVNVAQSWGKFVEGPFIGSDVEQKCIERLAKIGVASLKGKKVGIVGAGTIGMPLAMEMKRLGADVTLLEYWGPSQEAGKKAGMTVTTDRAAFFGAQDVIVGATGNAGIKAEDIALLKDGCILGSASSKLVEIDVQELAAQSEDEHGKAKMAIIDGDSHPPSVEYAFNDGRRVKLLARGYPMNFDGAQENIPAEHIQLTRALMVLGLLQATGSKVAGVKRLDPKLQLDLLQRFKDSGVPARSPDAAEALEVAMAKLREAVAHPGSAYRRRGG